MTARVRQYSPDPNFNAPTSREGGLALLRFQSKCNHKWRSCLGLICATHIPVVDVMLYLLALPSKKLDDPLFPFPVMYLVRNCWTTSPLVVSFPDSRVEVSYDDHSLLLQPCISEYHTLCRRSCRALYLQISSNTAASTISEGLKTYFRPVLLNPQPNI